MRETQDVEAVGAGCQEAVVTILYFVIPNFYAFKVIDRQFRFLPGRLQ